MKGHSLCSFGGASRRNRRLETQERGKRKSKGEGKATAVRIHALPPAGRMIPANSGQLDNRFCSNFAFRP